MPDFIAHLDDGGIWLAAVVSGLVALGWLVRSGRKAYLRVKPWVQKAKAVLVVAELELQANGGGTIKDAVSKIHDVMLDVAILKQDVAELGAGAKVLREGAHVIAERAADMRAALADHVEQAAGIHNEQAAAIAHLAEALPIIARSMPHHDDAVDDLLDEAVGP